MPPKHETWSIGWSICVLYVCCMYVVCMYVCRPRGWPRKGSKADLLLHLPRSPIISLRPSCLPSPETSLPRSPSSLLVILYATHSPSPLGPVPSRPLSRPVLSCPVLSSLFLVPFRSTAASSSPFRSGPPPRTNPKKMTAGQGPVLGWGNKNQVSGSRMLKRHLDGSPDRDGSPEEESRSANWENRETPPARPHG
ncbi:hypothetical protein GGS23DRAFT_559684 [Durotheca rogersii]|uniref:uncharacterized protein n=1 Tax=Durotheca rogersii TaxID=419775 RepID=UPI00221F7FC0|nr:uncharacterized protein GGS23DRAFT_559684 [Durotheca rogersii]KAI5865538.1 hypothetical protein GGS23DRAFT_559684 [Durotheca rogersii]